MRLLQRRILFALLFVCALISRAADTNEPPAGLEVRDYTGWPESIYMNATEIAVQAVIIPAVGGRMVHFSLDGENILFENAAAEGKTMTTAQEQLWLGGYQCDVGSQGGSLPPHPGLLQGADTWKLKGDFSVQVCSPPDHDLGITIAKDFVLSPDTAELGVMQRMRNVSDKDVSYYLRDRTACKGGGFVFFPLNNKSRFKAGWSQRRQKDGKDFYDGEKPDAFQARAMDGVLVVLAAGGVTQIGADNNAGWIAYVNGKILLVKYFPWFPKGNYTDGGNTVEVYIDQRAVELSPLSPQTRLGPGDEYKFPEKWLMISLPKEITTWDEVPKLVKKIPATPFG